MEICIDFDGTCVTHEFPKVGKDIGAVPVLQKLVEAKHKLILYTMRDGIELEEAVNWFIQNEIPLYGINNNPTQHTWTNSPKVYAQLYIDDAALGCPLKLAYSDNQETMFIQYVDWVKVEEMLKNIGVLS